MKIGRGLQILEKFEFFHFFIKTSNFKNLMYPRSFLCEEATIKQHIILPQTKNFGKSVRKPYGNPDSYGFDGMSLILNSWGINCVLIIIGNCSLRILLLVQNQNLVPILCESLDNIPFLMQNFSAFSSVTGVNFFNYVHNCLSYNII